MSPKLFTALFIGGLATLFGLLAAASPNGGKAQDLLAKIEELRKAVLAKFDVMPGCSKISYQGTGDEAAAFWAGPADEYLVTAIALARKANLTDVSEITEYVARDLFPGCEWPPEPDPLTRVDKKAVWFALRAAIENRMEGP